MNQEKQVELLNLTNDIMTTQAAFDTDATANVVKGNKAAGVRARKASADLAKMYKAYRKLSVELTKSTM
jgi:hypothetical protein